MSKQPKILITVKDGAVLNIEGNCNLDVYIADRDFDADEPLFFEHLPVDLLTDEELDSKLKRLRWEADEIYQELYGDGE